MLFYFALVKTVGSVGKSIGSVHGVGSGVFFTRIDSISDVVPLIMFVPKGVKSKGGRLIEIFCRSRYLFSLLVSKSILKL